MAANADYSAHSSVNLQQPWHTYPVETTLSILGSSAVNGLNREQIAQRIKSVSYTHLTLPTNREV